MKPGDTIVECTSGNVGIAFAMVAAARGYKFVAVMGDSYSVERRKLIRAYGGKVLLFPGSEGSSGGNKRADALAQNMAGSDHGSSTTPPILPSTARRRRLRSSAILQGARWITLSRASARAAP